MDVKTVVYLLTPFYFGNLDGARYFDVLASKNPSLTSEISNSQDLGGKLLNDVELPKALMNLCFVVVDLAPQTKNNKLARIFSHKMADILKYILKLFVVDSIWSIVFAAFEIEVEVKEPDS